MPVPITILGVLFLLISHTIAVSAQTQGYHIASGDILSLQIFAGGVMQHDVQLNVNEFGEVNVPFLGAVKAEGLTIPELQSLIYKPLASDYYVNPEVHLSVTEYQGLPFYITGAVRSPGLYQSHSQQTLLKLIAEAGGATENRSDVAYILRDSTEAIQEGEDVENLISQKEPITVSLQRLLDEGNLSANMLLQPGDVVYIPGLDETDVSEASIFIEGEIRKPGEYAFKKGMTALNACIIAGGFNKFAAPNRTRIVRKNENGQEIIKIDLNDVMDGDTPDINLQPGDIISIPESWF